QSGPIVVEAVKDFRVDGIRGTEALQIIAIAALGRELLMLGAVEVEESLCRGIALDELVLLDDRLEEATADDFKTFFGTGGFPRRFHAADGVAKAVEGG